MTDQCRIALQGRRAYLARVLRKKLWSRKWPAGRQQQRLYQRSHLLAGGKHPEGKIG